MSGAAEFYLGLETGGTKAVATVLDHDLNVRATQEAARPAGATAQDTVNQLIALGRTVLAAAGVQGAPAAIGWGFGGPVDRPRNRPAFNFHEPGWDTLARDPATQIGGALGAPVFVENDCNVAGLAEAHRGAGSPDGLTFYMTLGSGVGGGIIWQGRILTSGPMGEGEIGHMKIVPAGAQCPCGQHGCVEAYCSGWGVGERAVESIAARTERTPLMETLLQAEPRRRAALLFAAWPGDAFAREQGEAFLNHLADAVANVGLLLAPSRLVLGGGLAQLPWLVAELTPRVESRLPALMRGHMQIRTAQLGSASVPVGAALHARQCLRTT